MQSNILLIQSDADGARSVLDVFAHAGESSYRVEWVTTGALGLQCLAYLGKQAQDRPNGIRAVLLDLRLTDNEGLQTFDRVCAAVPGMPMVILSSPEDEALAKLAVRGGALDYLLPNQLGQAFPKNLTQLLDRDDALHVLLAEKARAQDMLDSLGDAVISTDLSGRVTYLNPKAEHLTGWLKADAVGESFDVVFQVINSETRATVPNPLLRAALNGKLVGLPPASVLVSRDQSETAIEDSCALIHSNDAQVIGAVMVFHDVSEVRAATERLAYLAQHDGLTDLPNRSLLNDRLSQAIMMAQRHGTILAVLFLDLDGFKLINDSLGHPVGDRLLQSVAARLCACVRASDTVSRQGGDEFVVLLPEVAHSQDAAICAEKIIHAMKQAHVIDGHTIVVTVSVGIVLFPDDGVDIRRLLEKADSAMYEAKEGGRNSYQFFRSDANSRAIERESVERGLRNAIPRHEFELHYQPIVTVATGAIRGVEALLRWRRATLGSVLPGQFIATAEESGLIVPIGQWVLTEACRQGRAWLKAGLPSLRLAVNISAVELRSRDFVSGVADMLADTGFDPGSLELELTEAFLMQDSKSTLAVLKDLKELGVLLALDDFGTGYSSLSALRRFPIDTLKIDRSIVRDLASNGDDAAVVSAVINMGKSLKKRVVAEAVETGDQLAFLEGHGCEEAQGYYFSRPLMAEAMGEYLATKVAGGAGLVGITPALTHS